MHVSVIKLLLDTNNENRVFVTIPRFVEGVPASLGTVIKTKGGKLKIKPFPSWRWHRSPAQCRPDRIVSVWRTQVCCIYSVILIPG